MVGFISFYNDEQVLTECSVFHYIKTKKICQEKNLLVIAKWQWFVLCHVKISCLETLKGTERKDHDGHRGIIFLDV